MRRNGDRRPRGRRLDPEPVGAQLPRRRASLGGRRPVPRVVPDRVERRAVRHLRRGRRARHRRPRLRLGRRRRGVLRRRVRALRATSRTSSRRSRRSATRARTRASSSSATRVWDRNGAGIVPNTYANEAHAPQRRATIVRNTVTKSGRARVPISTPLAGFIGIGIAVAGGNENVVRGNRVRRASGTGSRSSRRRGGSSFDPPARATRARRGGRAETASRATRLGQRPRRSRARRAASAPATASARTRRATSLPPRSRRTAARAPATPRVARASSPRACARCSTRRAPPAAAGVHGDAQAAGAAEHAVTPPLAAARCRLCSRRWRRRRCSSCSRRRSSRSGTTSTHPSRRSGQARSITADRGDRHLGRDHRDGSAPSACRACSLRLGARASSRAPRVRHRAEPLDRSSERTCSSASPSRACCPAASQASRPSTPERARVGDRLRRGRERARLDRRQPDRRRAHASGCRGASPRPCLRRSRSLRCSRSRRAAPVPERSARRRVFEACSRTRRHVAGSAAETDRLRRVDGIAHVHRRLLHRHVRRAARERPAGCSPPAPRRTSRLRRGAGGSSRASRAGSSSRCRRSRWPPCYRSCWVCRARVAFAALHLLPRRRARRACGRLRRAASASCRSPTIRAR